MRTLLNHTALLVAGILAMALGPSAARAQKALVYCPTGESAGCETIVNALSSTAAFSAGVDKGFDGSAGTVDLKTVDLFQYSVVFVPSLSDDADGSPYALLRNAAVAERLKLALLGRRAFYSGTPDMGTTSRTQKNVLITNLASWASANYATTKGPGLVALQDNSEDESKQYNWATGLTGLTITADHSPASYDSVRTMTGIGGTILTSGGSKLAYANIASWGFYFPSGAPGISMDAVGQTGTSVGGHVVLVTAEGANTGGAWDQDGQERLRAGDDGRDDGRRVPGGRDGQAHAARGSARARGSDVHGDGG
jgi:hypothetical protein